MPGSGSSRRQQCVFHQPDKITFTQKYLAELRPLFLNSVKYQSRDVVTVKKRKFQSKFIGILSNIFVLS